MLAGQEMYTVEGLARDGRLSEPQRAIAERGGSQCGYCTPGFVVSLFAEYYRPGRTGACDPHAMGGNFCRCTGYRPMRDAAWRSGHRRTTSFATACAGRAAGGRVIATQCGVQRFERPASLASAWRCSARIPKRA